MKKKVLRIVIGIVVCIYLAIVVFTTGFLLNKNDFGVSKFLGKTILLVDENLADDYKKNSLLFIGEVANDDIKEGDKVFFYDNYTVGNNIKFLEVTKKEKVNDKETTFTMKDNSLVSGQYILGTKESTSAHNFLGKIISVFQSKWGFLILEVFPLFIAFLYEIYAIYREFKKK